MNPTQRYLLSSIYCSSLSESPHDGVDATTPFFPYLSKKLDLDLTLIENELLNLEELGLIEIKKNNQGEKTFDKKEVLCFLTKKGRAEIKVVLVGGVFDLLHAGHIHTLKSAKSLGDVLIIVVATDTTVNNLKKNRKIFHDENSRLELVSSIRFVDKAIIGRRTSIYETVDFVKPDIIALGYDQTHDEKLLKKNCLDRGLEVDVVRLSSPIPQLKSSVIKSELGNSFYDLQ
ncbi:adenylyltransferase/cytidyltransferase family protein [Candidatus Nitrosocosmicus hydrocola]|jgi:cytidyltransferase-like protein|uniref:adenylyltransferase/cytidyltransferase family protein n=1 Tax=Candidatus Nitrosocosmicus hydrocola TaxID=1826872 RepID=UPI0011E5C239|nr:adenylyltransferase/cytidyltransferase family protein [Candidatus Nitrosocosmicus hydrocola]